MGHLYMQDPVDFVAIILLALMCKPIQRCHNLLSLHLRQISLQCTLRDRLTYIYHSCILLFLKDHKTVHLSIPHFILTITRERRLGWEIVTSPRPPTELHGWQHFPIQASQSQVQMLNSQHHTDCRCSPLI